MSRGRPGGKCSLHSSNPKKVAIANLAESGESLLSFQRENRLDKILSLMKPGDYLFIEFAHNDQKPGGNYLDAFSTYKETLKSYLVLAKEKGGTPVLVTPMHAGKYHWKNQMGTNLYFWKGGNNFYIIFNQSISLINH